MTRDAAETHPNSDAAAVFSRPSRSLGSHAAWAALALFLTFFVHELGHWLAGEMVGESMVMTLNAAYPATGSYDQPGYRHLITAAGPAVTLLQAFLVFWILRRRAAHGRDPGPWIPFLAAPLVMRAMAGVVNVVNANDEGRLSQALGIGLFTLPLVVTAVLFYGWSLTCRRFTISRRRQAAWITAMVVFASVLILTDQAVDMTVIPWHLQL